MPKMYEAIRDQLIGKGTPEKDAKTSAAKIYNSKNPGKPMGPWSDKKKK